MKFGATSGRWFRRLCGGLVCLTVLACNTQTAPVTGPDVLFGPSTGQGTPDVIVTGGNIDLGLTCPGFPSNAALAATPETVGQPVEPTVVAAPAFTFIAVEQNTSGRQGEITSFSIFVQDSSGSGVAVLEFNVGDNTNNVLTFGQFRLIAPADPTGPSMTLTSLGAGGVCRSVIGDEMFIEDLDIDRNSGAVGRIKRLRASFLLNCSQGCVTFIDIDIGN